MAEYRLDALALPQSATELPGSFATAHYPAMTACEISVPGLVEEDHT